MSADRATWGMIKDEVGLPIGLPGCSPALKPLYNEAGAYFWGLGDWRGKNAVYKLRVHPSRCCATNITWPNAVETIEGMRICGGTIGIRNQYYQFLGDLSGPGWSGYNGYAGDGAGAAYNGGCIPLCIDKQEVFTSEDLHGPAYLKLYTERIEGPCNVILMGYDTAGNWIRTETSPGSGIWQDGVYLSIENLSGSGVQSPNIFASLAGIQFSSAPRN